MKIIHILAIAAITLTPILPAMAHEGHDDGGMGGMKMDTAKEVTITGEVIDMACYIDHGSTGKKHASCAKTCIESGLPVGLKDADGKIYLLIGAHKPANSELAEFAGKTITVSGKLASRDGVNLLENIKIVKK